MISVKNYEGFNCITDSICKYVLNDEGEITIESLTNYFRKKEPNELLEVSNIFMEILCGFQEALDEKFSHSTYTLLIENDESERDEEEYQYVMDEGAFIQKIFTYKLMLKYVICAIEENYNNYKELISMLAITGIWIFNHINCFILSTEEDEVIVQPCSKLNPFSYYPCHEMAPIRWVD